MQARQGLADPQPPSTGDRISLLRLAEQVSRNTGRVLAAQAIRGKWFSGELHFWVQWTGRDPSDVSSFLSVQAAPRSFLEDLEYCGLQRPPYFDDEPRGLKFQTIVDASESGLYLDENSARVFTSHCADVDRWSAACLFTSRVEAAQFWPWLDDGPKADDQPNATQGRRSPRGAKTAWKWEEAVIAASVYAYERGLPEKQADLVRYIAEWFGDPGPGETQIKAHIAPLYRALARANSR